jgi:hypothetical protein
LATCAAVNPPYEYLSPEKMEAMLSSFIWRVWLGLEEMVRVRGSPSLTHALLLTLLHI